MAMVQILPTRGMAMRIELTKEDVEHPHGIEIAVKGFKGDMGIVPTQVFIEVYKGKLRVHVWDGDEDPAVSHAIGASDD